jgi:hypothetical protein
MDVYLLLAQEFYEKLRICGFDVTVGSEGSRSGALCKEPLLKLQSTYSRTIPNAAAKTAKHVAHHR